MTVHKNCKWFPEEDAALIDMWNGSDLTLVEIAEKLNKAKQTTQRRVEYLRLKGVEMRIRGRWQAVRAKPDPLPSRNCNICEKPFIPSNKYRRYCTNCRKDSRIDNIGRTDGNWALR